MTVIKSVKPASEFLQELLREPETASVFAQLAKVSSRWQELLFPSLAIRSSDDLSTLNSVVRRALTFGLKPGEAEQLAQQLDTYAIEPAITDLAQSAISVRLLTYAEPEDPSAHAFWERLQAWSARVTPAMQSAIDRELTKLMAEDFTELNPQTQVERVKAVYKLLDLQLSLPFKSRVVQPELLTHWIEGVRAISQRRHIEGFGTLAFRVEVVLAPFVDPLGGPRQEQIARLPRKLYKYIRSPWLASPLGS